MVQTASLREAYGKELLQIAREDNRIVALDADLSKSTMSCYLAEEFPERFFEMGIAEQNMISTAAGLSLVGKIPFAHSFAVFATGRPFDQIRQGITLPDLNVKICGSSCGLSDDGDGATHQSIEDVSIMRSLPNMTVIVPVDAVETKKVVRTAAEYEGPVYIRIHRQELPVITEEDYEFKIGEIYQLQKGQDITIFASGYMVYKALMASEELKKDGITAAVYNVPTIKPINNEAVIEAVTGVKGVLTVEEHSITGGLGSTICEVLDKTPVPVARIGIEDTFGESSDGYEKLLAAYGLTVEAIVTSANKIINNK